jgi:hypothetical protein
LAQKYYLNISTIEKAYAYIDIFLSHFPSSPDVLQLIASAAILLAIKVIIK